MRCQGKSGPATFGSRNRESLHKLIFSSLEQQIVVRLSDLKHLIQRSVLQVIFTGYWRGHNSASQFLRERISPSTLKVVPFIISTAPDIQPMETGERNTDKALLLDPLEYSHRHRRIRFRQASSSILCKQVQTLIADLSCISCVSLCSSIILNTKPLGSFI